MKKNLYLNFIIMIMVYFVVNLFNDYDNQLIIIKLNVFFQNYIPKIIGMLLSYYLYIPMLFAIFVLVLYKNVSFLNIFSNLFIILIQIYLNSFLKLISFEFRPNLINNDLKIYDCEVDFGMPSGHLYICSVFLTMFKLKFLNKNNDIEIEKNLTNSDVSKVDFNFSSVKWNNKINFLHYILFFIIFALVSTGRITNGAHSIFQCIMGYVLGSFITNTYYKHLEFNFKLFLLKTIKKVSIKNINKIKIICLLSIMLPLLFNQLIFFRKNDIIYNQAIEKIYKDCNKHNHTRLLYLNYKNYSDTFFIFLILFALWFINISKYDFVNKIDINKSQILNVVLLFIPVAGIYLLFEMFKPNLLSNSYFLYLMIKIVVFFFINVYYFIIYPYICYFLKIEKNIYLKIIN